MKRFFFVTISALSILVFTFWLILRVPQPFEAHNGSTTSTQPEIKSKKQAVMSEKKKRVKGHLRFDAPDKFAEYHRAIRTRDGEDSPTYGVNYRVHELLKARQFSSTTSLSKRAAQDPLPWEERGPGNVAGRARIILVDPDDTTNKTWFVGSAGGGVWKTTDAGQTWEEMTIGIPNLATTTLAMPASNSNVIYMGTGEGFGTFAFVYGQGIWKSADKGVTWNQLTSTAGDIRFTNTMRLLVDPNDENILVAATSTGARNNTGETSYIFRSTDGGDTWALTYTSEISGSSNGRVEHVIAHPGDFNVQYAAVNGSGILKSTNGGQTWQEVFSTANSGVQVGRMELAIAPSDPSRVYAAAEGGRQGSSLFFSPDAGDTWQKTIEESGNNLNWLGGQGWYDNAIAVHPYDPNTVYVGGIDIIEINLGSESIATTISRLDESETSDIFSVVTSASGSDFSSQTFLPTEITDADLVPLEVRFGPGKSQKAHRFIFSFESFSFEYQDYIDVPFELWDTENNRQLMIAFEDADEDGSWNPQDSNFPTESLFLLAADYNDTTPHTPTLENIATRLFHVAGLALANNQMDSNNLPEVTLRLVLEDINVQGTTMGPVTDGYGQYGGSEKGVHVDHHYILLHPTDTASEDYLFLNANDGGIAFSEDKGETFTQSGETFSQLDGGGGTTNTPLRGLNTAQFYGVDKMNGGDRYVGGTQDNGSWVSPMDADDMSAWSQAPSGDGFEAAWHYFESDWVIETSQQNVFYRSLDGGTTWEPLSPPGFGPFLTRIGKSNQDPDLIFGVNERGVIRSEDFGTSWTQIDLPGWGFSLPTVRISTASADVVWAANAMSSSETPYVSEDGGLTFKATNSYTDVSLGRLTDIVTHPTDPRTAFALFSFSGAPKVLKTTDLGDTWEDLSGFGTNSTSNNGFPDVATYSLVVMPYDTNIMWVGTEIGLFASTDGGQTWAYADNGLPAVAIYQMRIVNDEVVLATHGRGIWSVSLPELQGYEPPPFTLKPSISSLEGGIGGNVSLTINLRQAYDSTWVMIDGDVIQKFEANTERQVKQIEQMISTSEVQTLQVDVMSYLDGQALMAASRDITITPIFSAQASYSTDFSTSNNDMYLNGFYQDTPAGFSNGALHSAHPYEDNKEVTALLLIPIIVDAENAVLSFDDIALIEPGEQGAPFGNPFFYDYVVVEGSSDGGISWTPLADGYDATFDSQWLEAYEAQTQADPQLFVSQKLDLLDTFAAGDEVLIRFRLFADQNIAGWGWIIDNLQIQEATSTSTSDDPGLPSAFSLHANYPNPFNPTTTISYELPQNTDVEMAIYDVSGRLVRSLLPRQEQAAGTYTVTWDGRNEAGATVASGMYLYRMSTGAGFSETRRMVLIK